MVYTTITNHKNTEVLTRPKILYQLLNYFLILTSVMLCKKNQQTHSMNNLVRSTISFKLVLLVWIMVGKTK